MGNPFSYSIFHAKRNFIKNNIQGQILIDLSKAFDRVDRNKPWKILYEKGLPLSFINMIKIGHENNQLCSKVKGEYSKLINNNIGVFQGSPLSPILFIIYADYIMSKYNKSIKRCNNNITKSKTIIRNNEYEKIWTNSIYNKINNIEHDNVQNNQIINENNTSLDHVLYADDTAIEFKKINDLEKKLYEYNNKATNENFKINWDKIKILTGKDIENTKKKIQSYNEPYNKIECVNTSKILGHITNTTNNLNEAVDDRIQKANAAWHNIRNSVITDKSVNKKIETHVI